MWNGYTTPYHKRPLQTFSLKLYFVLYFLKGEFIGPNYYITHVWPSDIARNQFQNRKRKKTPSFTSLRARRIRWCDRPCACTKLHGGSPKVQFYIISLYNYVTNTSFSLSYTDDVHEQHYCDKEGKISKFRFYATVQGVITAAFPAVNKTFKQPVYGGPLHPLLNRINWCYGPKVEFQNPSSLIKFSFGISFLYLFWGGNPDLNTVTWTPDRVVELTPLRSSRDNQWLQTVTHAHVWIWDLAWARILGLSICSRQDSQGRESFAFFEATPEHADRWTSWFPVQRIMGNFSCHTVTVSM